jgi:hypothetical protein
MGASTAFFGSVCEFPRSEVDATFLTNVFSAAAKNLAKSNGLKLNNAAIKDPFYVLKPEDLLGERVAIVKAGPHRHLVLALRQK